MMDKKKGECVEKIGHSCGTSDGLQVFYHEEDDTYDGYCFACGTYVADPYQDRPSDYKPTKTKKTDKERQEEINEIAECSVQKLEDRKLSKESLDFFNIKVGLSQSNGKDPETVCFPYHNKEGKLIRYKVRLYKEKKFWCKGFREQATLFGWEQAKARPGKRLYITEGEYDAVALYGILKNHQSNKKFSVPPVCSVTNGVSGALEDIKFLLPELKQLFEEVVLVFDNDKPGQDAIEAICRLSEGLFKYVVLPHKDANKCVLEGKQAMQDAFNSCTFHLKGFKNTRLVNGSSLYKEAKRVPKFGNPWPWEGLTKLTRGRRPGETIYWGAGVKMGKSEIVNAISAHIIKQGKPIMLCKPEEANSKTVKLVCGKLAGRIFHDPKIKFDDNAFNKAFEEMGDKLHLVDLYQFVDWKTLKEDIIYCATSLNVRDVIIDPITCLVKGSSSERNEQLEEISKELSAMAKDHSLTIDIFCHLKAPTQGPGHEKGAPIESHQFAGSRAMMRHCNYMFGLWGDKNPDLKEEERNYRDIILLEDREFGETGKVHLHWNKMNGMFSEVD